MNILSEIKPNNVLEKAKSIVELAQFEILATMDLAEELKNPLPDDYFLLLQKKVLSGISLARLAFGTKKELEIFKKINPIYSKNYKCILTRNMKYKRMLLVDRKYLMFAREASKKRKFYYTEDTEIIAKYSNYFKRKNRNVLKDIDKERRRQKAEKMISKRSGIQASIY